MKKTRIKYLLKSIRKNLVSFIAVAFIAATSIAVFLGLQSVAEAILDRANEYFISNELESMEITCAYGLTEEDMRPSTVRIIFTTQYARPETLRPAAGRSRRRAWNALVKRSAMGLV